MDSGYGVTTDGVTTFVNASTCNYYYRPDQPPIVFDLPSKEYLNDGICRQTVFNE